MTKKTALFFLLLIYILSYAIGLVCCLWVQNIILKIFIFDSVATIITFIFSTALRNSSVYDAYWSFTPMVIGIWLFIESKPFSLFQIAFFAVFFIWSIRLTLNWVSVFTDFSYEDWRYRKYREESSKFMWPIINFFGIHYVPTFLVFLGTLPLFVIAKTQIGPLSILGLAVMVFGILLEFFADREMHVFLKNETSMSVCRQGLWKYSRHPNYLGEITFWLGVFLAMLPYGLQYWYYCIGVIGIAVLFNVVSVPLMEGRQLARRPEYRNYRNTTSRLLLLPNRKS